MVLPLHRACRTTPCRVRDRRAVQALPAAPGLTLEQLFAGRNIDMPAAKARMTGLMADEGLDYDDRTMTYKSRRAQGLAKGAETQQGGGAVPEGLVRAHVWGAGED